MEHVKRSLLVCFAVLCGIADAPAQLTNHLTLEDLRQLRLPDVVLESQCRWPGSQREMAVVWAMSKVDGVIGGTIRFELLLPETWNGRFVMGGGGGFVGTVQNSARDSVNRGYATVGTDTGHGSQPNYMADWALNDLEAQVNFGYLRGASDGRNGQGYHSELL